MCLLTSGGLGSLSLLPKQWMDEGIKPCGSLDCGMGHVSSVSKMVPQHCVIGGLSMHKVIEKGAK